MKPFIFINFVDASSLFSCEERGPDRISNILFPVFNFQQTCCRCNFLYWNQWKPRTKIGQVFISSASRITWEFISEMNSSNIRCTYIMEIYTLDFWMNSNPNPNRPSINRFQCLHKSWIMARAEHPTLTGSVIHRNRIGSRREQQSFAVARQWRSEKTEFEVATTICIEYATLA